MVAVSVPYRGATFLNKHCTACVVSSCYPSFRPLSGSYISQYAPFYHSKEFVSVPYRGATFLNTISANPPPVWCKYGNCVAK